MIKLGKRILQQGMQDRYLTTQDVDVKVLFSSENPSLLGKSLSTQAIDVSPRGFRLEVTHPVEIDSVLDVVVLIKGEYRSYNLTGNVRWRLPHKPGVYQIGLVLRERADVRSDFSAWKAEFESNFEPQLKQIAAVG